MESEIHKLENLKLSYTSIRRFLEKNKKRDIFGFHKFFELKPNIAGVGFNFNELLKTLSHR